MSKKNKKSEEVKKTKTKKTKNKAVAAGGKTKKESAFGNPIRNLIITALVCIVMGVAFLVKPSMVYTYCGYAVGGLIGLVGLAYIIIYFCKKPVSGVYRYEFGLGLVALLAGAYVALGGYLSSSGTTGIGFSVLLKIIGILMAADGVLKLQYSVDMARMKYPRWWVALIFSVLGIALGVAVVLGYVYDFGYVVGLGSSAYFTEAQNAFIGGMMLLGVAFCVNALLDLLTMMMVVIRNHKARREEAIAEGSAMVAAAKQEEIGGFVPEEPVFVEDDVPVVEVSAPVAEAPAPVEVPEIVVEAPVESAE
ncbi:MAG: DUF308 domain-containing protein [Oscillospiraceae bacterium]